MYKDLESGFKVVREDKRFMLCSFKGFTGETKRFLMSTGATEERPSAWVYDTNEEVLLFNSDRSDYEMLILIADLGTELPIDTLEKIVRRTSGELQDLMHSLYAITTRRRYGCSTILQLDEDQE